MYLMNINLVSKQTLSKQILMGFESGKSLGMILIDLKESDTLDHDITLKRIHWFGSYLTQQYIAVSIDKNFPETEILNCDYYI